jgi:hypothetical protein
VTGKRINAQSIVVASTATNWYGHEGMILRFVFKYSTGLACQQRAEIFEDCMFSMTGFVKQAAITLVLATAAFRSIPAYAGGEFPFGMAMTLDVAPQPGSKRLPNLDIGDNGEAVLELWCKGGKGQFSVAGNTVIFVAGQIEDRDCPPAKAQADDELVSALSEAATWKRQGDFVSFIGTTTLRFLLNTN